MEPGDAEREVVELDAVDTGVVEPRELVERGERELVGEVNLVLAETGEGERETGEECVAVEVKEVKVEEAEAEAEAEAAEEKVKAEVELIEVEATQEVLKEAERWEAAEVEERDEGVQATS